MKKTNYCISRPPLHEKFGLPSRKELLKIKPGDLVKLIFILKSRLAIGGYGCERMWVEVKDTDDCECWVGGLRNTPAMSTKLQYGEEIMFHPLNIIDYKCEK
jgi:hypothetical protein